MTPNDLIDRVSREPSCEVLVRQSLRVTAAGMLAADSSGESRVAHFRHILGPPASDAEIGAWTKRWPCHPLPSDLKALLVRMNGIHLWADLDTGRAYQGIAPLEEWDVAATKMWGSGVTDAFLTDRYLAISYHADGAAFVVLNVDTGMYYLMDSAGADDTSPIGSTVDELLDWVWNQRIDPRAAELDPPHE